MKNTKFLSIGTKDVIKAVIIAILTPALVVVQQSLSAGSFTIDWKAVAMASIGGFLAYITKNLLTNNNDEFLKKDA